MGNQQPKKINKVSKAQIEIGALKARIHLELIRDRKNNQVIKGEKQLVNKVKAKSRNKTEEALVAERVINGLKYAQACNQLAAYAASIRGQANFLAENMNNPQKIQPWLPQIYSLIYAADLLGLSSLKQFKDLMRALNDPMSVNKYVNPEIIQLLQPTPTAQEFNIYFLEFSQRNNISIEQINIPGHKISKDFKPTQPSKDDSFADLEKKLADELNKANINGNQGGNQGGNSNQGWGGQGWGQGGQGNQGGFVPGQGWPQNGQSGQGGFVPGGQGGFTPGKVSGQIPSYYDLDKNKSFKPLPTTQHNSNPYGIRATVDYREPNIPEPKIYDNVIPSNPQQKPKQFDSSKIDIRSSIVSIDDIPFYPQIQPTQPKMQKKDDQFDRICQILRAAM